MRNLKSGDQSLYFSGMARLIGAGVMLVALHGSSVWADEGESVGESGKTPVVETPAAQPNTPKSPQSAPDHNTPPDYTPVREQQDSEPAVRKQDTTMPVAPKPASKEPIAAEPVAQEPVAPEPATQEPVAVEPKTTTKPDVVTQPDGSMPASSTPNITTPDKPKAPVIRLVASDKSGQDSLLGSYLAGRVARGLRDHDAAAKYFGRALKIDPGSDILLEQTFVLQLARGDWEKSLKLAKQVIKKGEKHRFSRMVLGLQAVVEDDFAEAENQFSRAELRSPLGKMIGIIVEAWLQEAKGESKKAFKTLDGLDVMNWSKYYQDYHRAMIADQAGRSSLARKTYQRMFKKDPRSLRLMEAYVRHLSATGASKKALKLLATHIKRNGGHPLVVDLQQRVKGGEKLAFIASTPREGLSELYYGIGDALTGDGGVDLGMIYLQAGLRLRPDLPMASMALAEAYEESKHFEQANRIYDKIGKDSPLWPGATVRRAFNLNSLEKVDEAKEILDELIALYPKDITAVEAQGNILRAHKRYGEAVIYYTKAIDLLPNKAKFHWKYFYSRGVCFERLKDWPKAEKDLLQAHKLDPDQALVLNYLGYSWVDQGLHLNKAMRFIRRAVELKPDDGYFVDSLGWAHYRLHDYKKASAELERAVELKPDDPVINDHLGDAYWRVGRKLEAQFQWSQSLTLKPDAVDILKIKAKIKDGMPKIQPVNAIAMGTGGIIGLKKAVAASQSDEKSDVGKEGDDSRVYVVRSGDSLWTISKRLYGKGRFHQKLLRANRRRVLDGNRIKPGLRLIVPRLR